MAMSADALKTLFLPQRADGTRPGRMGETKACLLGKGVIAAWALTRHAFLMQPKIASSVPLFAGSASGGGAWRCA
jgi:hypothetical protein